MPIVCCWKSKNGNSPSLSVLAHRLNSTELETCPAMLTEENHNSRLALLNLVLVCGNFQQKRSWLLGGAGRYFVPIWRFLNVCRGSSLSIRRSHFRARSSPLPRLRPLRIFQGLRAMSMTTNKGTRTAIPHRDTRNLSCRTRLSSPRRTTSCIKLPRDTTELRRIRHGCARAIENLRRVRLSLVPSPHHRECLLQAV